MPHTWRSSHIPSEFSRQPSRLRSLELPIKPSPIKSPLSRKRPSARTPSQPPSSAHAPNKVLLNCTLLLLLPLPRRRAAFTRERDTHPDPRAWVVPQRAGLISRSLAPRINWTNCSESASFSAFTRGITNARALFLLLSVIVDGYRGRARGRMGEIESEGLPRVRCPLALQTLIEVKRPMSCGMYIYRERG